MGYLQRGLCRAIVLLAALAVIASGCGVAGGVAPPTERVVTVLGSWEGPELDTFEGDAKVRAEPFDAIELDLGRIWRW